MPLFAFQYADLASQFSGFGSNPANSHTIEYKQVLGLVKARNPNNLDFFAVGLSLPCVIGTGETANKVPF